MMRWNRLPSRRSTSPLLGDFERSPFLALVVQQRPAEPGKRPHKAKRRNREILLGATSSPASLGKVSQSAVRVRLLTGGLLAWRAEALAEAGSSPA